MIGDSVSNWNICENKFSGLVSWPKNFPIAIATNIHLKRAIGQKFISFNYLRLFGFSLQK